MRLLPASKAKEGVRFRPTNPDEGRVIYLHWRAKSQTPRQKCPASVIAGSTEWTNFTTAFYLKISSKLIQSFKPYNTLSPECRLFGLRYFGAVWELCGYWTSNVANLRPLECHSKLNRHLEGLVQVEEKFGLPYGIFPLKNDAESVLPIALRA